MFVCIHYTVCELLILYYTRVSIVSDSDGVKYAAGVGNLTLISPILKFDLIGPQSTHVGFALDRDREWLLLTQLVNISPSSATKV